MTTRARASRASRPLSRVSDEMLRDADIGGAQGAGSPQEGMILEGDGGEENINDGGVNSDMVRAQGGRGVDTGEISDGGINVSDHREQAIPDEDHRGRGLISGGQAFPPSLLTSGKCGVATNNMLDNFACISMITEKRWQRNTLHAFIVRKLEKFKSKAKR